MKIPRWLATYYAATVLFLLLDYGLNINVRVAFLEPWPGLRALYYVLCLACFVLMLWRPGWSVLIGTGESLITLVALILSMGVHVMVPNDAIFEKSVPFVTTQEIINFVIAGSVAYVSWMRGVKALKAGTFG